MSTTILSVPTASIFFCPVKAVGAWAASSDYRWAYAMNHHMRWGKRVSQVVAPTKAMLLTENGCYPDLINMPSISYGLFGHDSGPSIAGPAHGGKGIPFAYVDGHAEFWRRIPPPPPAGDYIYDSVYPWTHRSFWGFDPPWDCGWCSYP